jgi:hypothetical protein
MEKLKEILSQKDKEIEEMLNNFKTIQSSLKKQTNEESY